MNYFLRVKHWQLFLLLMGLPIIVQSIGAVSIFTTKDPGMILTTFPIIMVLFIGIFLGWFYALGTSLHKKLPDTMKMSLSKFKLFLFIPMAYMLGLCIWIASLFVNTPENGNHTAGIILLIIPLHLFSMFCLFYCIYFIAKSLKAVELQKPVSFNDYAGEFFLIWFFPIGIWIIQPRINTLFDQQIQSSSNS
jgi:hypothetical protein